MMGKEWGEEKTVRRAKKEEFDAQNTLHQTKALLGAQCISSPFVFLYILLKEKVKKGGLKIR